VIIIAEGELPGSNTIHNYSILNDQVWDKDAIFFPELSSCHLAVSSAILSVASRVYGLCRRFERYLKESQPEHTYPQSPEFVVL
jgi:hypothetical protein